MLDGSAGYIALVNHLRFLMARDNPTKKYIISAAPQCYLSPSTGLEPNIGALIQAVKFDLIYIQFYDNPSCSASRFSNSTGGSFNWNTWDTVLAKGNSSTAKVYAGVISDPANTYDYLTPTKLKNLILALQTFQANFGGVMVFEATSALNNNVAGKAFGSGFRWPVVFSMHATKAFSVGEGGLIYSGDPERIRRLRTMGAFGFEQPRSATMLGLNSKLSEVAALTALLQLERFPATVRERVTVARWYRNELHRDFALQSQSGYQRANAFISVLLPTSVAPFRPQIAAALAAQHIGTGTYFSPHLAEQPYFQQHGVAADLRVTQDVASRVLALPLLPTMSYNDVARVASALRVASGVYDRSLNRYVRAARKPAAAPEVLDRPGMVPGRGNTLVAGPR